MLVFGSIFGGKVLQVDKQWIETKYFLLMVPLFPVSTMFVTHSEHNRRNGFEISSVGGSIGHGYLRFFCLIFAIAAFGFSLAGSPYMYDNFPVSPALTGTVFALLYAWSVMNKRYATGEHLLERKRLGAIVGLNALPEWIPFVLRKELEEKIRKEVLEVFGNDNIKEIVQNRGVSLKHTALLYAYLRYKIADADGSYQKEYETVLNRYNQALLTNSDAQFSELKKQMPDDLTDDASRQL
jgi:hypothetical protein